MKLSQHPFSPISSIWKLGYITSLALFWYPFKSFIQTALAKNYFIFIVHVFLLQCTDAIVPGMAERVGHGVVLRAHVAHTQWPAWFAAYVIFYLEIIKFKQASLSKFLSVHWDISRKRKTLSLSELASGRATHWAEPAADQHTWIHFIWSLLCSYSPAHTSFQSAVTVWRWWKMQHVWITTTLPFCFFLYLIRWLPNVDLAW